MKYKTHNDVTIDANMTHRQGYLDCEYKSLIKAFGKPLKDFDNYKCDAEWLVIFDNGMVGTIYNYKNGINYLGRKEGIPKTKITDWNVGGFDSIVVDLIKLAIYEANNG